MDFRSTGPNERLPEIFPRLVAIGAIVLAFMAWAPAGLCATAEGSSRSTTALNLSLIHVLAMLDILVVTIFVIRGAEVRLVLFLGALPLFLAVGRPAMLISKFASEMANAATIVPICSAMGFAYVLKLTECDQHLVQLLVRP